MDEPAASASPRVSASGTASPKGPSRRPLANDNSRAALDELRKATIRDADHLYKQKAFQQVLETLLAGYQKLQQDTEILWRLCRIYYDLSELQPKETRSDILAVGFQFAEKGLELDKNHAMLHKWWAILCSLMGDYQPTKEKIGNAFKIKEHAMRANELAPNVASIGWIERTAAAALFASPPSSTYEEALGYFLKASQIDEKFVRNAICIGDCYAALKKYSDAKTWYKKAVDIPFDTRIKYEVAYHEEAESKFAKHKSY